MAKPRSPPAVPRSQAGHRLRRAVARLYHVQGGQLSDVTQRAGISLPEGAVFATFADVDNDGRLDLFVIGGDLRAHADDA